MDMLWTALGICTIVCVVFYVLAAHWQRVLRQQSWTIRGLAGRLRDLEEVSDPQFRRRLDESSPMPLEQVLSFSFRLSERFWRKTLALTDQDWGFVRKFGSFVGSVKLERWRSHTVATVAEALPSGEAAPWQKRSVEFYSEDGRDSEVTLWELRLGLPGESGERPSSLELVLGGDAIELRANLCEKVAHGASENGTRGEKRIAFFSAPLNPRDLAKFRSDELIEEGGGANGDAGPNGWGMAGNPWRAFYSATDDEVGFEWHLCVRDLTRKADWERWRVIDPIELGRS